MGFVHLENVEVLAIKMILLLYHGLRLIFRWDHRRVYIDDELNYFALQKGCI
jgi:hypothetical protein